MALDTGYIIALSFFSVVCAIFVVHIIWSLIKRNTGALAGSRSDSEKATPNATSTRKFTSGNGYGGGARQNDYNAAFLHAVVVGDDSGPSAQEDTHSHSNAISSGYHVSDYPTQHTTVTSHCGDYGYSGGHSYGGSYSHGGCDSGGGGYGGGGDSGGGGCGGGGGD
ncbi:hypothetical protein BGZ72_007407 [Mortierella alpina]|nr:hypothetical protein BGZ72_007407 [Mortierella alpina]